MRTPSQGGPGAKLCFLEIGPLGSSISSADRTNLANAVAAATAKTAQPLFPKPQPSPRLYAYGSYVDELLMLKAGGAKYYYASNHLYSVAALTDATGAVVERYKYDAYGKQGILASNGTVSYSPSDYGQYVGFTGRYHDWETGLVYFRARYFDTGLGRFVGRDPLTYINGTSLYNAYYVPNRLDPSGMFIPLDGIDPDHTTPFEWFLEQTIKACQAWQAKNNPNGGSPNSGIECSTLGKKPVDCLAAALAMARKQRWETITREQWRAFAGAYNAAREKEEDARTIDIVSSMGIGGLGGVLGGAGREMIEVTHFTNQVGVDAIQASGTLRAGTYVTLPKEVSGLNAVQVETSLEIQQGRGAFSTTIQVPQSTLATPPNGVLTSGGKAQFILTEPATTGPFLPTPHD